MSYIDNSLGWDTIRMMLIIFIPFVILALRYGWINDKVNRYSTHDLNIRFTNYFWITMKPFKTSDIKPYNDKWDKLLSVKQYESLNIFKSMGTAIKFNHAAMKYKEENWHKYLQPWCFKCLFNAIINIIGFGVMLFPLGTLFVAGVFNLIGVGKVRVPSINIIVAILWIAFLAWRAYKLVIFLKAENIMMTNNPPPNPTIGEGWMRRGPIAEEICNKYFGGDARLLKEYTASPGSILNQYEAFTKNAKSENKEWIEVDKDGFTELVSDINYDRNTMGWWFLGFVAALVVGMILLQVGAIFKLIGAFFGPFVEAL